MARNRDRVGSRVIWTKMIDSDQTTHAVHLSCLTAANVFLTRLACLVSADLDDLARARRGSEMHRRSSLQRQDDCKPRCHKETLILRVNRMALRSLAKSRKGHLVRRTGRPQDIRHLTRL